MVATDTGGCTEIRHPSLGLAVRRLARDKDKTHSSGSRDLLHKYTPGNIG